MSSESRAPFQSVKNVTLFGPKSKKSKPEEPSAQRVLEKETQHHMLMRELECYRDHLRGAKNAKAQALRELERAQFTLQHLSHKLESLNESKRASIVAAESAKLKAKQLEVRQSQIVQEGDEKWKATITAEREGYKTCNLQLIADRQELAAFNHEFDTLLQDKTAALHKLEDCHNALQVNQEKQSQLAKEVASLREKVDKVNATSIQAQDEHNKILAEKESIMMTHKQAREAIHNDMKRLQSQYIPEEILQGKIEATMSAIKLLQVQLNDIQTSDLQSIKGMASELDNAKIKLQQVLEDEVSIRNHIPVIKQQLKEVGKEKSDMEERALKAESIVQQMKINLEDMTKELETVVGGCICGMQLSLKQLIAETENATQEAEEHNKKVEMLKQETSEARIQAKEIELELKTALKEANEAKIAEKVAEQKIQSCPPSSGLKGLCSTRKVSLPVQEFDSLMQKIEESEKEADIKVANADDEVKSINGREKQVSQKMEMISKEKEALLLKISNALKRADMAEAANGIVQSELQKWNEYDDAKW